MNNIKCETCSKTSIETNAVYCPFCARPYIHCRINMCDCNENIVDTENCIKCGKKPIELGRKEYDTYINKLDKEYERLKKRLDTIWRKVSGRTCTRCTRNTICDSCYGPGSD